MNTKCGFVAVIGLPNAGKSTFVNAAVGAKVSIVTRKPQTTRGPLRGIAICDETQIVFVDTPGIFDGKRKFDKAMSASAFGATKDADWIVMMIDVNHYIKNASEYEKLMAFAQAKSSQTLVVLNKVDRIANKATLLPITQDLERLLNPKAIFMISALKMKYVQDVLKHLANVMPEGPWLYPEDQISDKSERFMAAEITRRHLIDRLGDELPFQLTVVTVSWEELPRSAKVYQTVLVSRETHKRMVIGKGGERIKEVGIHAREEISGLLGRKVHLFLDVKVDPKWADNPQAYADYGLDFS